MWCVRVSSVVLSIVSLPGCARLPSMVREQPHILSPWWRCCCAPSVYNSSIEFNNAIAYSGIFTSHDSFRKFDRDVRTAYFGAYLSQYARRLQDFRFSAALTSMGITFDPLWTRKSTSPEERSVVW